MIIDVHYIINSKLLIYYRGDKYAKKIAKANPSLGAFVM